MDITRKVWRGTYAASVTYPLHPLDDDGADAIAALGPGWDLVAVDGAGYRYHFGRSLPTEAADEEVAPEAIALPARFYWDHADRCGGGTVTRETARKVWVILTPAERKDLLDDARHYAGPDMAEWWADGGQGVILSARATVRALEA